MNRQKGSRARGDGTLYLRRIDVHRGGLDIHEDGRPAGARYLAGGGDKGEGRRDHLVARPDLEGIHGQAQCVGARSNSYAILAATELRQLVLELSDLGAEGESTALEHFADGRVDLAPDGMVLRPQIAGWDHLPASAARIMDRMRAAIMSMATSLNPPSGMMTSAWRLLGSTNSRCIGRTVLRYWRTTDSVVRPRSLMSRSSLPDEADVGIGVDVDLDVHQLAQRFVGKEQDALEQDDRLRLDAPRLCGARVCGKVVDRNLDRLAGL